MQKKIILFLNRKQTDWVITDQAGVIQQTVIAGDLSQLTCFKTDAFEIIAIIPAEDVLLSHTVLPRLNRRRFALALPYALEDQLLEEPETLHFTAVFPQGLGRKTSLLPLPVAVIKKHTLENWLAFLKTAGIHPDICIPITLAIPYAEHQWHIAALIEPIIIRTGLYSGFNSDAVNLEILLSLKIAEEQKQPETMIIYDHREPPLSFHTLPTPVQIIKTPYSSFLEIVATTLHQQSHLNLLHTTYAPLKNLKIQPENKKWWRITTFLFFIWIGLIVLSSVGSLFILALEQFYMHHAITHIDPEYFQKNAATVSPQARLENQLQKIMEQQKKDLFFQWVDYITPASAFVHIQGMDYQKNQLTLNIVAADFTHLDNFITALRNEPITLIQQRAVLDGSRIKAVFLIQEKKRSL